VQYVLLFLEGIVTFISPCLLPMLPVFLIYFAGEEGGSASKTLFNAIGFVLGFTVVFVAMGAFAGLVGRLLADFGTAVNIISGLIVIAFGLNYMGFFRLEFLRRGLPQPKIQKSPLTANGKAMTFASAFVFGLVFAISWTPCISVFLGAALLRASQQGYMAEGMFMLFVYSMGLGLPFIASAVLIDRLKNAFAFIKRNYHVINILSGGLLVLVGVLMVTGIFGRFVSIFGGVV